MEDYNKISNVDFRLVVRRLVKPLYVLQMNSGRRWSARARYINLMRMRQACLDSIDIIDKIIDKQEGSF